MSSLTYPKGVKKKKKLIIIIRFLRKATRHNDHYIINIGGQRPKIGGN